MYGTKLQKWEQITTQRAVTNVYPLLWCMVQSYKNESKSQQFLTYVFQLYGCDVWYKVTKMRANHNLFVRTPIVIGAVMYGTKLQKWEQITTRSTICICRRCCDVWYKVTKMRANHNSDFNGCYGLSLWCMVQSYKNESKSQLGTLRIILSGCCDVWYKVTKMRANHNCSTPPGCTLLAVMYGTKLQKWEQITTAVYVCLPYIRCDVWYKVTKMRANHNLKNGPESARRAVMYGTKLQKWEQITTISACHVLATWLWCMVQSYKNRVNHNSFSGTVWMDYAVRYGKLMIGVYV